MERADVESGLAIWYRPSLLGREYAGFIDGRLRELSGEPVVRLDWMEPAYAITCHPRTLRRSVPAAPLTHLRARTVRVQTVQIRLCDDCLSGIGGECHTPGCALWLNRAPDLRIHPELYSVVAVIPDSK